MQLPLLDEFVLEPVPPYSFELTVRKPAGWDLFTPFEIWSDGTLWTGLRVDGEPVGLKLWSIGSVEEPEVRVAAYAEDADPDDVLCTVANRLSVEEVLSGFYEVARRDPVLSHAVEDLYGLHSTGPADLFSSCALAITLQMAPWRRSESMMQCLVTEYGDTATFDDHEVQLWPAARTIADVDAAELRDRCRLGYRAEYLVGTAQAICDGFPTLEELAEMGRGEAKDKLLELPGIGDYSADIVNPHGGFPIDSWSAEVFAKLLFDEEVTGRDAVERVKEEGLERYRDCSWLAFLYVVHDLENLSERLDTELRLS